MKKHTYARLHGMGIGKKSRAWTAAANPLPSLSEARKDSKGQTKDEATHTHTQGKKELADFFFSAFMATGLQQL